MTKVFIAVLIIVLPTLVSSNLIAQCDSEKFSNACIPRLTTGFNFLKSFKIDGENGAKDKVEYSYVFTKGTQYMINICAAGTASGGIVVSLFDSSRNQVATSKVNGQLLSAIAYPCNATGIYYMQYTFDGAGAKCGGSVLGFKR